MVLSNTVYQQLSLPSAAPAQSCKTCLRDSKRPGCIKCALITVSHAQWREEHNNGWWPETTAPKKNIASGEDAFMEVSCA